MLWRDPPTPPPDPDDDRLAATLTHYGIHARPGIREQMVLCPIHSENKPSARVNLDKQVWWCHACGVGGGYLRLIELMEGVTRSDARRLAASWGITSGDAEPGRRTLRNRRDAQHSPGSFHAEAWTHGGDGQYVPSWVRR